MWGLGDLSGLHDVPEDDHFNLGSQRDSPKHNQHKDKPSKSRRRRSEPYTNVGPLLESQRRGSIGSHQPDPLPLNISRGPVRRGSEPFLNVAQLQISTPESGSSENISTRSAYTGIAGSSERRYSEPFVNRNHCFFSAASRRSSQGSLEEESCTSRRRISESYSAFNSRRSSFGSTLPLREESDPEEKSAGFHPQDRSSDLTGLITNPDLCYFYKNRRISEPTIIPNLFDRALISPPRDEDLHQQEDLTYWNLQRRTSFPCEEFKVSTKENAYDVLRSMNMEVVGDKEKFPERMDTESLACKEYEPQSLFAVIPWHDVLYQYVFSCLQIKDLFQMRGVCRSAHACLDEYFTVCPIVNLTRVPARFTPDAFRKITHRNYRLRVLILRQVKGWLTNDDLIPALSLSSHITKVDLTSCINLSHRSVIALAGRAPGLQELYLRECPWMTMEAVMMISQNCPHLRRLDLTGCWSLQDEAIITISLYCRKLIYLSIAKIYGVTDNAVLFLAKNCIKLQHVNMHGCWRVTDNAIKMLGEYCPNLKVLQVKDCRDITDISLARLRMRGVKVDVLQHAWRLNPDKQDFLDSLKLKVQV